MKELPTLYKNENLNLKNHNKDYCYLEETTRKDISPVLDSILNTPLVYRIPVIITTKDNTLVTRIVKVEDNHITTINGDIIKLEDILNIEK